MILAKLKGYLLMAGAFIAALAVAWFKGRSSGAEAAKTRLQQDIDQAVALWDDYKRRKASTRQGK